MYVCKQYDNTRLVLQAINPSIRTGSLLSMYPASGLTVQSYIQVQDNKTSIWQSY